MRRRDFAYPFGNAAFILIAAEMCVQKEQKKTKHFNLNQRFGKWNPMEFDVLQVYFYAFMLNRYFVLEKWLAKCQIPSNGWKC